MILPTLASKGRSEELVMKVQLEIQFRPVLALAHVSAETFLYASSHIRMRHFPSTLALRTQQSPSRHEQFRQRGCDLQSMQVLRQASVAHFLKAEDPLDHSKHVLDLGSHAGFAAVGRLQRDNRLSKDLRATSREKGKPRPLLATREDTSAHRI